MIERRQAGHSPGIVTGLSRRDFLGIAASAITVVGTASRVLAQVEGGMYGQIGKLIAAPGKRDEVIANILGAVSNMPGCLSYIVAKDTASGDAIWISEVWDGKASHDASLSLPSVRGAIAKNMPLIAGFGDSIETVPVGGHGIGPKAR
jgi:quinol monooxygenase YgiN